MTDTGERVDAGGIRARRQQRKDERRRERMVKIRAKSGNRYRVHYDIDGPRVRLGIAWFAVVMASLVLGKWGLAVVYGITAAAAAAHGARTWRARGHLSDNIVAFGCTLVVVAAGAIHPRLMGAALLLVVVVTVLVSFSERQGDPRAAIVEAGVLLQVCVPPALAAGCLVQLADLDLGAAVTLIVLVSAYECGDYLVGSGAPNVVEGPVAGLASVLVASFVMYFPGIPPFTSAWEAVGYGMGAGVLAVLGQLFASVILPHSRAYAPALRRIDSLLLAAPFWYMGIDLFIL